MNDERLYGVTPRALQGASKKRLGVILSAILLVAILAICLGNYTVSRRAVLSEIMDSGLPLTRDTIYSEIHSGMMQPIFISSLMAHDTFLKDWSLAGEEDVSQVTKYLREIRDRYEYFSTFFVSARTNKYYHFKGLHKTIDPKDSHDVWYYNFVKSKARYVLDVDTDEASHNVLTIFINYRMEDYEGNLLGVTGVGIKLSIMAGLLEQTQEKYNRRIYLVDTDGLVQVHAKHTLIRHSSIREMEGIRDLAETILSTREGTPSFEYDAADRHILLTTRFIPELNWFLLVEQDEGAALATVRNTLVQSLAFGLLASVVVIGVSLSVVNRYQRMLEIQATTDPLTGLSNRRDFQRRFEAALSMQQRGLAPLSLILIDLDGLKAINDTLGHLAGDAALVAVARLAQTAVRPSDILARWGGDEFVVLNLCPLAEAVAVAERIRALASGADLSADHPAFKPGAHHLSVSCGVAAFAPEDTLDTLIHRADQAMYQAKGEGRDRVLAG
jgi:diguanylate cyclase (GGDEF)-like protein